MVDAFAARDGAAVFRAVNRVIEGGHEPRRFAADLLDRLRDLIVLAAVPDAAVSGLLDLPPDRAELMARQADRFGQAGLARAAEIVSTGLDQMRGATSPRLLLELMCAQVLLPGAATDEKSLLARLERLENRTPSTVPQSPRRPPQPAQDDEAERVRVPSPAARPAPQPPEQPRAASPPARPAPEPREPARPALEPPRPAPERARPPVPAPASAAPAPAAPAPAAPAPAAPAPGASAVDSLRQSWPAILDAVKRESKVAWMLLTNASVLSLEDGILTLRFPRDGEMKGFSVSGHDAILKRVLSNDFGLNATIKGVAGGDAQTGRPAPAAARPPAVRRDPTPVPSESVPPDFARPDDAARRQPRGRAVTGRPGAPERRTDRHGPHPA
jgi:DNA polymerase-3 subunit gamma/tau